MQILELLLLGTVLEVRVHHVDASEEGLLGHFVGGEYLDHPVYHLRSKSTCNCMAREESFETLALEDEVV